jgi:Tol biopolymer transport system component
MKPERWKEIEKLYQSAIRMSAEERTRFLADSCSDGEVRSEVASLLAHRENPASWLERQGLDVAADMVNRSQPGTLVGRTIDHYEILAFVGAGGMGEVYRARDLKLGRNVALKRLPDRFSDEPERVDRFEREAKMLASLNHPNIAAIYDLEESDGIQCLVLEFVEGESLAERLSKGHIPITEILDISRQIADALEAAHEQGVVHRDLKPANIMITPKGGVKVLDFGIAKLLEPTHSPNPTVEKDSITAGKVLGTPSYMSPEQARGKPVDKRTDIWAFGCVLYELLTGRRAFQGETITDTLAAVVEREPDWQAVPGNVPVRIQEILRRCLQKDARQRLRDIGDARIEIELGGRKLEAPAHSTSANPERRKWQAIAVVALLLAGGVAVRSIVTPPDSFAENPLANARFTKFTDFEGSERDAAISPDGKFVAFRADRDGPFDIWLSQVGTGRFLNLTKGKEEELLSPVRTVGFSPDSSEIWLAGAVPDKRRLRLMPLMGGTQRNFLVEHAVNVGWSPDGTRVAYHTGDPGDPMFVADRTGTNAQQVFALGGPGGHNHFPTWSLDGRWIYFVSGIFPEMDIWRIAAKGGTAERLTRHNTDVRYIAAVDNRTILYVAPDQDGSGPWLWALDVERKVTHRISSGVEKYISIAASADGRRLVASVANPSAGLWSVPILGGVVEERDVKPFRVPTVRALAPRFGTNALFYLSSSGAGDGLWRYQNGETLEIWKGADGTLLTPAAVSQDGQHIALVLRRQGRLRLYTMSADGAELKLLTDTLDVRGTASWSPEGKWIVVGGSDANGDGLFKIPVESGVPIRLVAGSALNPAWSPDGNLIVYNGPVVANKAPLLAVRPDGATVEFPPIGIFFGDSQRYRFLPSGNGLVYMQGSNPWQDFWLLDLETKTTKPLTHFSNGADMRTFDITPDGKQIVFDRLRENSDIVLIDRAK